MKGSDSRPDRGSRSARSIIRLAGGDSALLAASGDANTRCEATVSSAEANGITNRHDNKSAEIEKSASKIFLLK
jgi:hypothetical protein